jgi:primosomal protein N' (replication factor Y) (superfamily II helicase)
MKPYPKVMLRVAVALPVWTTFDYTVPEDLQPKAVVGCRVLVPFGKKRVTGYIVERPLPSGERELRDILEVLDGEPLFHEAMVPFFQWTADYYMHPLGRLIQSALPGGLNLRVFVTARLTEKGERALPLLSPEDRTLLLWVKDNPKKRFPAPLQSLYPLQKQGLLVLDYRKGGRGTGPLLRRFIRARPGVSLADFLQDHGDSLSAKNEREMLEQVFRSGGMAGAELCARYSNGAYLVKKWIRKGMVEPYRVAVVRDPAGNILSSDPPPERLSGQQEEVSAAILEGLNRKSFAAFLLHGVTGSGKTEVYYQAIEQVIRLGRKAILMAPEIALVLYMEGLFRSRLGDRVALYHSGLSDMTSG